MILSACSPYFKSLLEENPAKHPIIILKDVPFTHLTVILQSILQIPSGGEPCQTPNHHPERRSIHTFDSNLGVHVCRRSQCCPGPAATVSEDRRAAEGEGSGRGPTECEG